MKILVVDDEQDIQTLFLQRFRKERKNGELEIQFAISGKDALELLEKSNDTSVSLILSDINMPGMSGLELLKIIKDKFSELKVVMVTAYGNDNYYQAAMQYGAHDYLVKPIDFQLLKERFLK